MPGISMSLKARYVTQSSVYETQKLGPLTDRQIKKYQKQGRYGQGLTSATEKVRKKRKTKQPLKELFAKFL